MASVSYPVSNITAGVSTQEYSLRMDGQASDQSNVLNSPRYGLCKRPNSHYLSTFGTSALSAPLMFPLVYGGSEKIYLGGGGVDRAVQETLARPSQLRDNGLAVLYVPHPRLHSDTDALAICCQT